MYFLWELQPLTIFPETLFKEVKLLLFKLFELHFALTIAVHFLYIYYEAKPKVKILDIKGIL